jgi:hypothetical protein
LSLNEENMCWASRSATKKGLAVASGQPQKGISLLFGCTKSAAKNKV